MDQHTSNLNALDESTLGLDRDDYLRLMREDLISHIKKTHEVNTRQYNLRVNIWDFGCSITTYC